MNAYEMRDIGEMKWFLQIRIVRDRNLRKLWLCQDSYIQKIVSRFHLENSIAKTPMATEPLLKYTGQASVFEIRSYQEKVGSCNYDAVITRPDIAYTTQKLSKHLLNPGPQHQKAVDRCLAYLNTTKTLALKYGGSPDSKPALKGATDFPPEYDFIGYSDASHGDDIYTKRSTQRHKVELFGGIND